MRDSQSTRGGFLFATAAFGLWGLLPIYFVALSPSGPAEILAFRILLSLLFCLVILLFLRRLPETIALIRTRQIFLLSLLAALLIFINWSVYVYASVSQFIVEAALGYFINPLVTVGLGVFVLGEKLRGWQWFALSLAVMAVLVLSIGYGSVPFISLALAFSFGLYGFVKKKMGPEVKSLDGLTLETIWLIPLALALLAWVARSGELTFGSLGAGHLLLILMAGAITSVPLLFFGAAAKRLKLTVLGLIQYLTPVMQFLFGVIVMGEPMPMERWVGFSLVWLALVMLGIDAINHQRTKNSPVPFDKRDASFGENL